MGTEKRQNYSTEFKVKAIRMVIQKGLKASEVNRELTIQPISNIYGKGNS